MAHMANRTLRYRHIFLRHLAGRQEPTRPGLRLRREARHGAVEVDEEPPLISLKQKMGGLCCEDVTFLPEKVPPPINKKLPLEKVSIMFFLRVACRSGWSPQHFFFKQKTEIIKLAVPFVAACFSRKPLPSISLPVPRCIADTSQNTSLQSTTSLMIGAFFGQRRSS